MILETILQKLSDYLFTFRFKLAIKKHHGRGLCFHCLDLLIWQNYEDREIAITPSHKIMLFCPICDARAKDETLEQDGEWIVRAFRRYYDMVSGLGNGPYHFNYCLENVLQHYGWVPKVEPVGDNHAG